MKTAHNVYPRRIYSLPPVYSRWVQAAAAVQGCTPEDILMLAVRSLIADPRAEKLVYKTGLALQGREKE